MDSTARPKVTVCIATYNQARYIEDCVRSALAQAQDVDLEILVGDDGSVDGTADILRALKQRTAADMTLICRPANIGGTENYQDLVARARGDFIAHLDGDDAWLPGKLLAQMRFLAAHPACVAVYNNAVVRDAEGRPIGRFTDHHPEVMGLPYLAGKGNFLMHSSLLYRAAHKQAFLALQPPVIDYLIHLTLARAGPIGFIDEQLAIYRHATATSTVRNSFPLVQRLLWQALSSVLGDLEPRRRRGAAAHFAGEILIARVLGKAGGAQALIGEAANAIGASKAGLLLQSVAPAVALVAHHGWQKMLRSLGRTEATTLHARV
jgi:glycosyltransferase involved in cell wall biosynthesis